MYLKDLSTMVVKRVPSSSYLDGLTLTLRQNVHSLERWDGWESKFFLLKKVFSLLNGPKMVNSIPGGSTINQSATS